jgi:hypothetical protein
MTDDFSDDPILGESLDDLEPLDTLDEDKDDADFEPSSDVVDIDDMVEKVYGNKPRAGVPFSMADEVDKDEEDRHGM